MKSILLFCMLFLGDFGKTLRLPSTKEMLKNLEQRIDTRISKLDDEISNIDAQISSLEDQMTLENKQLRNDVLLIYENLIDFEDKINQLLTNGQKTDTKDIDKIEGKSKGSTGQSDDSLKLLETRMDKFENDLKSNGDFKQKLADAVKTITTAVSLISDDVGEMRDGMVDMKQNLKSVKDEIGELRNDVRSMEHGLVSVEALVNNSVETAILRGTCFDQLLKTENKLAMEKNKTDALTNELLVRNSSIFKELHNTSYTRAQCKMHETGKLDLGNGDMSQSTSTTKGAAPEPSVHFLCGVGVTRSGVYNIQIPGSPVFQAYCDMDTDGGGWLVFQRRMDGSVDFYRNWTDYKQGFGNLSGEFWLGNDLIRNISKVVSHELRIDLWDWDGATAYAKYDYFSTYSKSARYDYKVIENGLSLGRYSGTAADGFRYKGDFFSTKDRDNDQGPMHCAVVCRGAWWYGKYNCGSSNLNGHYYPQAKFSGAYNMAGISWKPWKDRSRYSLKGSEMKIRPK